MRNKKTKRRQRQRAGRMNTSPTFSQDEDDSYAWTSINDMEDDESSLTDSQLLDDLEQAEAALLDDSFASQDTDFWREEEAMHAAQGPNNPARGLIRSYTDLDFLRDANNINMMPEVVMGQYLQYVFDFPAVVDALERENTMHRVMDDLLYVISNMQDHEDLERVREYFVDFENLHTYPTNAERVLRQYRQQLNRAIDAAKNAGPVSQGGAIRRARRGKRTKRSKTKTRTKRVQKTKKSRK